MVAVEPCVGIDVVAQPHPGGTAQLMFGEQAVPDSIGAAEDPPRQGVGAVRTWWHTEQPADDPWTAETPVDNLPRAAVRPCGQPKVRATIVVWRDRTTDKTLELVDPPRSLPPAGPAGPAQSGSDEPPPASL